MFTPSVCARVHWYVYVLRNPAKGTIFYVGKGMGNRVFQHATHALGSSDDDTDRLAEIRSILGQRLEVETFIVRHGIEDEEQAYEVEAAVMDAVRLAGHPILNVVSGHGQRDRGLAHTSVIASIYDAPEAPLIEIPSLLIRIPRLWLPRMTDEELYEATHGWWRVGIRRESAQVAFAVSSGIIRAVYRIKSWRQREQGDRDWEHDLGKEPRWGFDGEPAKEFERYRNSTVAHLFRRGQANPVKYMNC